MVVMSMTGIHCKDSDSRRRLENCLRRFDRYGCTYDSKRPDIVVQEKALSRDGR